MGKKNQLKAKRNVNKQEADKLRDALFNIHGPNTCSTVNQNKVINVPNKNRNVNYFNQNKTNWQRECDLKSIKTNEELRTYELDFPSISSSMLREAAESLEQGVKVSSSPYLGGKFLASCEGIIKTYENLPLEHYFLGSKPKHGTIPKSINFKYDCKASPKTVSQDLLDYSVPSVEVNTKDPYSISAETSVDNPKHKDKILHSPKIHIQESENSSMSTSCESLVEHYDLPSNTQNSRKCINSFFEMCAVWKKEREKTLKNLEELKHVLHNDQLFYNKAKRLCKRANNYSRIVKERENSSIANFLAFVATFISDAADGVTSIAQACNIDGYLTAFKTIMKKDEEITKLLYASRSTCLKQYEDVEEIIKCFHSDDLNGTLLKIADSLELEKFWNSLEKSQDGTSPNVFSAVESIISKYCNQEAMNVVSTSLLEYVSNNPAALAACNSAARTVYNIIDWTTGKSERKDNATDFVNSFGNQGLMLQNQIDVAFLEHIIERGEPQAKLESKLEDAIDSLQFEMEEITLLVSKLENYITE